MTTNKKHLILTTTKCSVAVALLFWVLRKTNLTEIFLAAKDTNIPLLMAALFIYFLSYYIRSHRWRLLLRAQGVNASIPDLLKSYMVGIFFSNFLPSTLGGDAVRVYDAWQLGASKSRAVATVIVDRFLGLLGLMLFAVGSLLFAQQLGVHLPSLQLWLLLGAMLVFLLVWMLLVPSRQMVKLIIKMRLPLWQNLQQKLINIIKAFLVFRNYQAVLSMSLGLSLMVQISVIVHYYLIAKALNLPVTLQIFFLIVPLVTVIMVLPISINGIGLRENAFVLLLGTFASGISRPEAIAFSWLAYGIVIIQGLLGGIVYALRK
ncbi:MAG: flippase-like domain-containing protein [Symploca sp. SIO3C6]|nr:flippase-like domain-containing protein [Symploca sp. SIO3C6]